MHLVHRTTGDPDFATRRCFLPLPILGTSSDFHPVTRVRGFLKNPSNLHAFYKMASKGGRAESATWSEKSLLISIETFREPESIDVQDAARCSRWYLVDGQVQMACHRNVIDRPLARDEIEERRGIKPEIVELPSGVRLNVLTGEARVEA
jgi:hypothetical protein